MAWKPFVFITFSLLLLLILPSRIAASHDDYEYKWPWPSTDSATITGLPYLDHHSCTTGSCTDALDVDIVNYNVLAGEPGSVTDFEELIDPSECNPNDQLGNYISVQGAQGSTSTYAHLAGVNSFLTTVLQGDQLGNQGHTGFTQGGNPNSVPPIPGDPGTINGVPYAYCGDHLHWEFGRNNPTNPVHPSVIDGDPINGGQISSSNEQIGSTVGNAGVAIRTEFQDEGGWATVGWVHDAGRGLGMHSYGDGQEQTFKNHDGVGGIYVPDSMITDAFWVQPSFWAVYEAAGGPTSDLGNPIGDLTTPCVSGAPAGCTSYQPFEGGCIWTDGTTVDTCTATQVYLAAEGTDTDFRRYTGGAWAAEANQTGGQPRQLKHFGGALMFVRDSNTLLRSTDSGETWSAITPPTAGFQIRDFAEDSGTPGGLWGLWQDNFPSPDQVKLYYSSDNGATWGGSPVYTVSVYNSGDQKVAVHPTDPDLIAVASEASGSAAPRVAVSVNGGTNWSTVLVSSDSVGFSANAQHQIYWTDSDRLVYWYFKFNGTDQTKIWTSDNYGANWTLRKTLTTPQNPLALIRGGDSGPFFAALAGGTSQIFLRSSDGTSWEELASPIAGGDPITGLAYEASIDRLWVAYDRIPTSPQTSVHYVTDASNRAAGDWLAGFTQAVTLASGFTTTDNHDVIAVLD
jgi:hypothetical protein